MKTILLIEDNDNNISLIEDIFVFDNVPARLEISTSGEEAISRASELQPALILMDLQLPGIDGMETTQRLKCDPQTRQIPIWVITAHAMKGYEEKARLSGCCEYITKPILVAELADRLRAFLTKNEQPEEQPCLN